VVKLRSPCRVQLVKKASSHLRINPANTIAPNREIGRIAPARIPAPSDRPAAAVAPSGPAQAPAARALTCAGTQWSGQVLPPISLPIDPDQGDLPARSSRRRTGRRLPSMIIILDRRSQLPGKSRCSLTGCGSWVIDPEPNAVSCQDQGRSGRVKARPTGWGLGRLGLPTRSGAYDLPRRESRRESRPIRILRSAKGKEFLPTFQ
jgi:hypothetical protein